MLARRSRAADVPLAPPDKQPPDVQVPEPPKRKVGWALVGLGKLALEEVLPAFGQCELSRPTALVSGHRDKAEKVAGVYGIKKDNIYNYENYDKIADNPDVDVIYIILPNNMHAEYTIRGLKAGKHVLCEKPMSTNVAEAEQMIAAAKQADKKLMIAYRLRYEPFNQTVIDLCEHKRLGDVKIISASNCQQVEAPNIRLSKALGGGALGDVGIYCLNAARYITGEEPTEVTAFSHRPKGDPRFREVAASTVFTLKFPGGALAHCDCSFDAAESRRYRIQCGGGFIDLERAFGYRGQQLHVWQNGCESEFQLPPIDHFAAEMDHFSACVLHDVKPLTPGEEGLADMRAIAAIERAAESGRVEKV